MSSRLIEGPTQLENSNGYFYKIIYYCATDSDLAAIRPVYGDTAAWAPIESKVSDIDIVPLVGDGAPYRLILSASPKASGGTTAGSYLDNSPAAYSSTVLRSYENSEILMKPEWFGVRKAKTSDNTNSILNLTGAICEVGDWISLNATASSAGTIDISYSPFVSRSLSGAAAKLLIGQRMKVDVFVCEWYTKVDINNKAQFKGVSGNFSGRATPYNGGAGVWRAVSQHSTEVLDNTGTVWTKIVRKVEHAPDGFTFSASKNNGTWRW